MNKNNCINYIELPSKYLESTKSFFEEVFGWEFVDYGPDYSSMTNAGVDGGFYRSSLNSNTGNGSALVVLYADNLETTLDNVKLAGGTIVKDIFSFPGGRRFHFCEPSGNELAVWSE